MFTIERRSFNSALSSATDFSSPERSLSMRDLVRMLFLKSSIVSMTGRLRYAIALASAEAFAPSASPMTSSMRSASPVSIISEISMVAPYLDSHLEMLTEESAFLMTTLIPTESDGL